MAFDLLTGFVRDFRASRKVAGEIARMNHLNDAQLADLGLDRPLLLPPNFPLVGPLLPQPGAALEDPFASFVNATTPQEEANRGPAK